VFGAVNFRILPLRKANCGTNRRGKFIYKRGKIKIMPDNNLPAKYPFKRNLCQGMKGREVEVLQMWLDDLNGYYNFRRGKTLKPTGFYGDETRRFVTAFQLFVELYPADGMHDYRTHDLLQHRYANFEESVWNAGRARGIWNN
jgi:peptidoglycan hydrolase-like protein with peptidoglycan-binding domain